MTTSKHIVPKALALLCALTSAGTFAGGMTTQDGIYTEAQAKRGEEVYERECKVCHAPEFYEMKFQAWNNQPLNALYDVISFSMPESNPGGLALQDYTDVLAYIFSVLGYPTGDKELNHNDGSMGEITIKTK